MLTHIQSQDAALSRSQQKLEALVHSIDGIVWECTPDTFQFTFVSRQSERLLGYKPEEWMASPRFWHEKLHPEDATRAAQTCHEAVARRQPYHYEYRMIAAEGRVVWIRESGVVLVESDQPVAVRGIFQDITEQKRAAEELARLNQRLAESYRQAGMAEIATGVLHNVGNVLNSVNVSATLVQERLRQSKVSSLIKTADLLRPHAADPGPFLTADPKGRRVVPFLLTLADHLGGEQQAVLEEIGALVRNIEHIKEIVAMQQSYACVSGVLEPVSAAGLVEDALRVNESALARHRIQLVREFAGTSRVLVDKHKVLQILINLIRNAKQALDHGAAEGKVLTLGIAPLNGDKVRITVQDNGVGIAPENLTRIFAHGFTTKKQGHGFGLHSAALAAKEIGGGLTAHSDGLGRGAVFTLELPMAPENNGGPVVPHTRREDLRVESLTKPWSYEPES
jgi:PAS domain S-box-containing protein